MKQYIDKSALVAEIEKKIRTKQGYSSGDAECGYRDCAKDILSYLDSLEVKNVDLNREIDKEIETRWRGEYLFTSKFRESAKYFFELGLKAKRE